MGIVIDLLADFADADHAFIGGGKLVADLESQAQLLGVVLRGSGKSRVFLHFEGLGLRLAVYRELHGVDAGRDGGTGEAAGPHDEAGEAGGVRIAQIPDEVIEPWVGRDARGWAAAGRSFFEFRRSHFYRLRGRLAGILVDRFAGAVQKFDGHIALRTTLERVRDHRAAGGIFAHRYRDAAASASTADAEAKGVLGLE